jgi:tRNA(fMet)-specific endonuclease VapC
MSYLLDTCVISELTARYPRPSVIQWLDTIDEKLTFLSVITIGEIQKGISKLPVSQRKQQLSDWLLLSVVPRFEGRLLVVDERVMLTWGNLVAQAESGGRKLPAIDSLIAVTALHHGLQAVTRNEVDFRETGVTVINPWRSLNGG